MKNTKPHAICVILAGTMLAIMILSACSSVTGSLSPNDTALVSILRDRLTETLSSPDGEDVYWVRSGTVYHLTPDCRFIAEKEEVICSSAAESGKSKLCAACAESAGISAETDAESSANAPASTADAETETAAETDTAASDTAAPDTAASDTDTAAAESSQPDDTSTVYWTKSGKVWHLSRGCPSLANSDDVSSGSIAESGKERACKRCG